jgi:AcrR family transcriptional regulator
MARPTTITREQILEAARAVFLEKGFEATTATIAERAGVSEGSLFNHFDNKQALFFAAMDVPYPGFIDDLPWILADGDIRERLEGLVVTFLNFLQELLPKVMMLWSHRKTYSAPPPDSPPARILRGLTSCFRAEMARGRMKNGDAELAARLLMGAVWSYCALQMTTAGVPPIPKELYAKRLVAQIWAGLDPAPPTHS